MRLSATDPAGNNIYTWTWPLHTQLQIQERVIGRASPGAPIILAGTNATEILLTNGPRVFRFNRTNGIIMSLTVSNQLVSFTNGPSPAAGGTWTVSSVTNFSDGTNYFILVQ